jgi:hypothetical protein
MMEKVNRFKVLMGMPEVGRFNAVLFGGKLYEMRTIYRYIIILFHEN